MNTSKIKIWDLPVRIFHWLLVACFATAYLTEDDFMTIHTYAGYTIMGLLSFRIIWGIIGPQHACFSDFVQTPSSVLAYLKDIFFNRAKRYLGHNPAGGAMVIALIVSLLLTTITGLAAYATEEAAGPLVSLMDMTPNVIYDGAEDVHEFFANFTLALIFFHIVGVVIASLSHKENLVKAMVTGYKQSE
ncbi:MAG: cytochrome b/b6 domain-containing protein [Gammaproteobacteria bacterium]|nr:cytochrome b/b6 domain-containing protein [Gammaproteobacteria bacterium]